MLSENEVLEKVIEYLESIGIPRDVIAINYKLPEKVFVDIAVIDKKTNQAIIIFLIKATKEKESCIYSKSDFISIGKALGDISVKAFLISMCTSEINPDYIFQEIDLDTGLVISRSTLNPVLNYEISRVARISETVTNKEVKKKKTVDKFNFLS